MKGLKKIISIVLTIAMVITLITVTPSANVEAKVKIQYGKKLTITVGKSDKIYVKGKGVKFTSKNKKIATVSKKGVVKAKKVGKCKITVKQGKSKATATITVIPAKVKIKSATVSGNSAKITWSKTKGAAGYYLYRSTKKKSGYKKIATIKGASKKSYTVKNLAGATHYFKLKAYGKVGKKTVTSAKYSDVKSVKVWKLVWNDEFNGTKLDTTKWNNNGATGAGGYGNKELQNYQMQYSEVKNGNFIIKPQFSWNPRTKSYVANSAYSTKIWTNGQFSVKYGKVEFRAKLPKGQGTWAAAWMLGDKNKWPLCGEIDVLETTKDPLKQTIPQSIHNARFNGMPTSPGNKYKHTTVKDATTAYHTYGIIWNSQTITFTIDGKTTWVYDPDLYKASGDGNGDINIWPFNQSCYLILNCAIGGTLGGDPNPNYWTKIGTDNEGNEIYQDYYYIDWVRVYQ